MVATFNLLTGVNADFRVEFPLRYAETGVEQHVRFNPRSVIFLRRVGSESGGGQFSPLLRGTPNFELEPND